MSATLNNITSWSLRLWVLTYCFEGVLRYQLENMQLPSLLYARDALLLVILLATVADGAVLRNMLLTFAITALLVVGGAVGLSAYSPLQVAFGFKVLLPACAGIAFGCSRFGLPRSTTQASLLCVAAIAGLILNVSLGQLPWTGVTQDIMGIQIEGTREWHHGGVGEDILRPTGFARASFFAASQILMLGIFVFLQSTGAWRTFLWMLALVGIVITTSKGPAIAWFVATAAFVTPMISRTPSRVHTGLLSLMTVIMIALPPLSLVGDFENRRSQAGTLMAALTDSFIERLSQMWPDAFAATQNGVGGFLLGRGVGGVGSSVMYFQPENFNSGDNLFVYLLMEFGVLATIIMAVMFSGLIRLETLPTPHRIDNRTLWVLGLAVIAYGIVANVVEDQFTSLCLGAAVGRGLSSSSESDQIFEETVDESHLL